MKLDVGQSILKEGRAPEGHASAVPSKGNRVNIPELGCGEGLVPVLAMRANMEVSGKAPHLFGKSQLKAN